MVEADYNTNNVREITVRQTQIWVFKDLMVHFLLHINEDFDDDLLKDATDLLEIE
jgi:hypothetical protein